MDTQPITPHKDSPFLSLSRRTGASWLDTVTLKFQHINGKVDMLLIIGDSSLIYINTGTAFKAQNL